MAYLALARKYRPQRFADMIGQEHITRTLANAIKTDRVHHAYLFCGVRGLGKTTAARILAKCLVCEQGPTPEPCNECAQCRGVNEGSSVDVIEIDGASNNSVDDIRSLREQVNYLPQFARRKIYIIDEVHMLTASAFNALLKTLEEPPAHVTFMFATTDPHKVLPTILSRVSRLDYRRVRATTLVPYLHKILAAEGFAVEEEGLYVIARCGEGSVRDSLTLLDKVLAFASDPQGITTTEVLEVLGQASRFTVGALVQAIIERDAQAMLTRFETITESGSDLKQLALAILQHLRDLTVVKLTGSRGTLLDMSDDLYEQLVAQAEAVEASVLAQWFDRFARVFDSLENSRVPKLVVEMALLELVESEPLVPLGDLIARLDALASGRSLPGGAGPGRGGAGRGGSPGRGQTTPARGGPTTRSESPRAEPSAAAPAFTPRSEPVRSEPVRSEPMRGEPMRSEPVRSEPLRSSEPPRESLGAGLESSFQDQLWKMVRGSAPPSAPPRREEPPARSEPPVRSEPVRSEPPPASAPKLVRLEPEPARAPASTPAPTPTSTPAPAPAPKLSIVEPGNFALSNDAVLVEPPRDPDAGCPSSRCVPRDAIAWKTMPAWDAWETFLSRVSEEDTMLGAMLRRAGLIALGEQSVVRVAAPATGFTQVHLRENPDLKGVFERLCADYFGEPMRLELVDATPSLPDLPSLELVDEARERRHVEAIEHDAQSHPRIRALLHTFGGRVERIEPLSGPQLPPLGQRGLPT